jgi:hypothetical protein
LPIGNGVPVDTADGAAIAATGFWPSTAPTAGLAAGAEAAEPLTFAGGAGALSASQALSSINITLKQRSDFIEWTTVFKT